MTSKKRKSPDARHPALRIIIHLNEPRWKKPMPVALVRKAVQVGFRIQDSGFRGKAQITVVLADDVFVQALNHTFRGKNKPTNVLSFPADSSESRILNPESSLGDIVLAFETVEREAKEQGKSFKAHAAHLLVHGTLHLLGFDHEHERDAKKMEALEVKILKRLGIGNPYS